MASFWNRLSSSKKNTDKGKNKMGTGSSQHMENINILEDMAYYDFGEYRASDVEFSRQVLPPCPPGSVEPYCTARQEEEGEQEDPEIEVIPEEEADDYASIEEAMTQQVASEGTSSSPQPYKSDMFIKHFRKV